MANEKIRVGVHSSSSITSYAVGFPAAWGTEQGASKTSFVDENHYLILLIEVFSDCDDSFWRETVYDFSITEIYYLLGR